MPGRAPYGEIYGAAMLRSLLNRVKRVAAVTQFGVVSVLMVLVAFPLQVLALHFDRHRRLAARMYHLFWGRLYFASCPAVQVHRSGLDRVGDGPYVVVSNHTSSLDIPGAFAVPVPLRVVIRHEHFRIPVVGAWLRFTRQVCLDRSNPTGLKRGLEHAVQSLRDGYSLLIFPEGTRSERGELGRFHRGAFRLAKDAGVAVLPVVQTGFEAFYPKGTLVPTRVFQRCTLQVLDPVSPDDFGTARALSRHVEGLMRDRLDHLELTDAS